MEFNIEDIKEPLLKYKDIEGKEDKEDKEDKENKEDKEDKKDNEDNEDNKFSEEEIAKLIRSGFICKVYGIITYQIIITTIVIMLSLYYPSFKSFLQTDYIIYCLCWLISIICVLIPFVSPGVYIEVPSNYITLTIFTLSYSYLVASKTCVYTPNSVITALILTFLTVVCLTIYAWKTDKDFTIMDGTLFTALVILIFSPIIYIFFPIPLFNLLLSFGGVIFICIYLIYDTQLLLGGHRMKFSEDDYILASIVIYVDIIILFLKLLDIFGKDKDNEEK